MRQRIISIGVWISGAVLTFILFLAMLACSILFFFDSRRRIAHAQCYWWSDAIIAVNPYWKVSVSGLEHIDRERTYVIVANHQSLADIVVLYQARAQFKWVAKESLFRIPVLGWCMALGKHIRLERGDFGSIKKTYRDAAFWLRQGVSVLFFPEGTRSENGEMRDFQNGSFKLAIKEKIPILPISIRGTGDAIPKGSWLFTTQVPISITVLPPIETAAFGAADFARLRDRARDAIATA